jgi:uncharacterized RDD family membrane protein YckC
MTTTADDYVNSVLRRMPAQTPRRSQIALELRGHIAERLGFGHPLEEVLRQLGDPVALAESYLSAVPLQSAPLLRRAAAKALDVLAVLVVMVPLAWAGWMLAPAELVLGVVVGVILVGGSLLFGLYTIAAEYALGQTFGKHCLGIRVVRESGARISLGQAVVRQLPMFFQVGMIDAAFALFTEKRQRAFELLSRTRTVFVSPETAR